MRVDREGAEGVKAVSLAEVIADELEQQFGRDLTLILFCHGLTLSRLSPLSTCVPEHTEVIQLHNPKMLELT